MSPSPQHDTGGAKERVFAFMEKGKSVIGDGLAAEHYEGHPPVSKSITISHEEMISSADGLSGFTDSLNGPRSASGGLKVNTNSSSARTATADVSPLFLDGDDGTKKVEIPTPEEVASILERLTVDSDPRELRHAMEPSNKLMLGFLFKNCEAFANCKRFRDRGWLENKEAGDAHFAAQRLRADQADDESEKKFYVMMQEIAEEMNKITGALYPKSLNMVLKCLDICMAPGGYTAAVLAHHKSAQCFAITLPAKDGGHKVLVPLSELAGLKHLDVTMLVNEFMDTGSVPKSHPGVSQFEAVRPFRHHGFDLVFCDGMVLRTQQRDAWREENEVTRLSRAQMILALQRVTPGGTVVMLLHKIDSWRSASILYTFSKFSKVETFKPARKHSSRSSFYMVAKDVQPNMEEAKMAVKEWKETWRRATFGGEDGTGEKKPDDPESFVREMLEQYGERLIEMGRPLWEIQANALSKTSYAGDGSTYSPRSTSISTPYTPRFSSATTPLSDMANSQGLKSPTWRQNRRASMANPNEDEPPKTPFSGRARQVSMASNEDTGSPADLVWGRPRQGNHAHQTKRTYVMAPPNGPRLQYASPEGGPREGNIPPSPTPKRSSRSSFYGDK